MKNRRIVRSRPNCRQLGLALGADRMSSMTPIEQNRAKLALAQILLQAAGIVDEEIDDAER